MHQIITKTHKVELGSLLESSFLELLTSPSYAEKKKMIIVDENTFELCVPYLLENYLVLKEAEIMVLPVGEESKALDICTEVWGALTDYQFQRGDLIINLGGGVVTDMGGFIASVFKRGVDFVNIPTSLLAMVDASVGGKTGVNFGPFKNQLGFFAMPLLTYCDDVFLETLEKKEILAGRAEMLKHGLIADAEFFKELAVFDGEIPSMDLIIKAVQIKSDIVERDFKENGDRKKLNFGHTIGHAIEGFLVYNGTEVTHGECVAWGMLVESLLSHTQAGLPQKDWFFIEELIRHQYPTLPIAETHFDALLDLMKQDKKNKSDKINFTLLKKIGEAEIDFELDMNEIRKALHDVFVS